MSQGEIPKHFQDRLILPVIPHLSEIQLGEFNKKDLLTSRAIKIKRQQLLQAAQTNSKVLTVDIGGTAIKAILVKTNQGKITEKVVAEEPKKGIGENYFDFLKRISEERYDQIGISTAGKVRANKLEESENFSGLVKDLKQNGGFEAIFGPRVFVVNDAVAAALGGSWLVSTHKSKKGEIILMINGGGIGGAYIDQHGQVWANEPGHTPLVDPSLNFNKVTTACNFQGRQKTCIERVGSMAAIEAQWEAITGEIKTGKQIAEMMYGGDPIALQLISQSALITATAIEGLRRTHGIDPANLALVGHGGAFKIEGFAYRVIQILSIHLFNEKILKPTIPLLVPKHHGVDNLGAIGVSLGAISNGY